MKRNILYAFFGATLLLAACTQDDFPQSGTNDDITLAITITDGGYANTASSYGSQKTVTRARDNDYRTEFTAGDACGLYVVSSGTVVYDNVKLTATAGSDGSLIWQTDAGKPLVAGRKDEHYFLYYPYQEDMTAKVTALATDDTGFFTPLINGWQPKADQSDYLQGYAASDLMTAEGTASESADGKLSLSFSLNHRMALSVIEMPKTEYRFTNTKGGTIPDYIVVQLQSAEFTSETKPYRNADGSYRYLVNPALTATTLTGSYDEGKKDFTVTPNNIGMGCYKIYKVDGGWVVIEHNLQVGDFLLADGNIVGKDNLTEAQKASVSAIVFWTPSETNAGGRNTPACLTDDKIMAAEHPACTHGLAVSVKKITYDGSEIMNWQNSHEYVKNWQAGVDEYNPESSNFVSIASNSGYLDNINRIYGYQNTIVLRAYNAYCKANGKSDYVVHPLDALDEFKKTCPAPAKSTGWFLPSVKELLILCYKDVDNVDGAFSTNHTDTRDIVNASISATDGDSLGNADYWSSSENEKYYSFAYPVFFSNAGCVPYNKGLRYNVRAVCAF